MGVVPKPFHPRGQARVHCANVRGKSGAIGLDRAGVSRRGRKIARPESASFGDRLRDFAFDESVRAIHES